MKKSLVLILVLVLLAVPVMAAPNLVTDGEGLLTNAEAMELEQYYESFADTYGFTPILVTTDSFGGQSAQSYAGSYYDANGYPFDGILYLVSLTEGEWYILTNGACYDRITNADTQRMGEHLVEYLRDGDYADAFAVFPELAAEAFQDSVPGEQSSAPQKNIAKRIIISMLVGLAIGGITAGILAARMKTVRSKQDAADYVRAGSMHLTRSRDIFLYSHVTRTAKPKSSSSGGSGGSRGGSGGRI